MAFRERRSRGPPAPKLCKIWCGERLCRPCALTPTRTVIKDGRRKARKAKIERRSERQDKRARHYCRIKPMSAHGFLRHVENRHRAVEICKLLRTAEISRVIHVGVRLTLIEMIDGIAKG